MTNILSPTAVNLANRRRASRLFVIDLAMIAVIILLVVTRVIPVIALWPAILVATFVCLAIQINATRRLNSRAQEEYLKHQQ